MTMYEPQADWHVQTPMGEATILLVNNYGHEGSTTFLCVTQERGQLFEVGMDKVTFKRNYSFGRGDWQDLKNQLNKA